MASQLDRQPGAPSPSPQAGRTEEREGLQLSLVQVIASALAAVSGAIVTSAFGVAGTITGAAIMSLVATSAPAIYSHSIKRTSRVLRQPFHPGDRPQSRAGQGARGAGVGGAPAGGYGGAGSAPGAGYGAPSGESGASGVGYGGAGGSGPADPTRAYGAPTRYGQPTRRGAFRTKKGGTASASPSPGGNARPGYTAPSRYGKGRRLDRKVGLALGIVMTFVIAIVTLTVIEFATGQSSAALWGQGGTAPSITGGGDTTSAAPKPTSSPSSPTYTGTPTSTPTPTPTQNPTSTPTAPPTSTKSGSPTPTRSPLQQFNASPTAPVAPSSAAR